MSLNLTCCGSFSPNMLFFYRDVHTKKTTELRQLFITLKAIHTEPIYVLNAILEHMRDYMECKYFGELKCIEKDGGTRFKNILNNDQFLQDSALEFKNEYKFSDLTCINEFERGSIVFSDFLNKKKPGFFNDFTPDNGYPSGHPLLTNLLVYPILNRRDRVLNIIMFANKSEDFCKSDYQFIKQNMHPDIKAMILQLEEPVAYVVEESKQSAAVVKAVLASRAAS